MDWENDFILAEIVIETDQVYNRVLKFTEKKDQASFYRKKGH